LARLARFSLLLCLPLHPRLPLRPLLLLIPRLPRLSSALPKMMMIDDLFIYFILVTTPSIPKGYAA
jgi:hypothetical protein